MHDREQLDPEIGAGLPELFLDKRAAQRVLHQIVCPVAVARDRPGIASQSRDLLLDESVKFGQFGLSSGVWLKAPLL
jgi:hypothetical protein